MVCSLKRLRRPAPPTRALALAALALCPALAAPAASAQVVTDGSLGAAGPVAKVNGTYAIPESLGRRHGANLFHSFSRLDLAAGEVASFSGAADVGNVLARVTGGQPSNIDGTLRCTIPNASFYLVNPAGVVFGPSASIDVSGSFAVGTADFIGLADGRRFEAAGASDALLTTAPPAAFGFLGSTRSAVTINGARLGVGGSRNLSVVGGDVRLAGGRLEAPGGRVNLAAVASSGEARLEPLGPGSGLDVLAPAQGNIELTGGSRIDVSADAAGHVAIRGGSLKIEDSELTSTTGAVTGGNADLIVTGPAAILRGGLVSTNATLGGEGGRVFLSAGDVLVDPQGDPRATGIRSQTQGSGTGGSVSVLADSLRIQNGGRILAQTSSGGDAGDVRVDVTRTLSLEGPGSAISSETTAQASSDGGDVSISARDLRVRNLAFVSASTAGSGKAGAIDVAADRIHLDGFRRDEFTGIGANTQSLEAAGRGGTVEVLTQSLAILRGAGVSAKTFAPELLGEDGARIDIRASRVLRIDGRRTPSGTGINAEALNGADGGNITVRAGRLDAVRGQITAAADGNGGSIMVRVPHSVRLADSEIAARAEGNGGNIDVDPVSVVLTGSRVSADAVRGNGGDILIRAQAYLADRRSSVTASSEFGLAGNVQIATPENEIAGGLVQLPGDFQAAAARLQEICGVRSGVAVSSFIVAGRGGAPPEPGGWQSDWEAGLAPLQYRESK